jgi:hypothetical protein
MRESAQGPNRPAGYMNIARRPGSDEIMLAPEPHGAWMPLDHPRALRAPAGTELPVAAVARFQLIAAVGMSHTAFIPSEGALVAGSGPVALGCCLELMRRGTTDITLLTSRDDVPFARDLDIRLTQSAPEGSAACVIDTTGNIEPSLSAAAAGGVIGLLGTPESHCAVSALLLHRRGVAAIGMHELSNCNHAAYQNLYTAVLAWLATSVGGHLPARWCSRLRANQILDHYRRLATGGNGRDKQPVTIVEWS